MGPLASPRRVAAALGVSESSIKRWCDQGRLEAVRTPGGHRRIRVDAVLRLAREDGPGLATPGALYAAPAARRPPTIAAARRALVTALLADDFEGARDVLEAQWRGAPGLDVVADEIVGPALERIGEGWSEGRVPIYVERRACELLHRCFFHLGAKLAAPGDDAPTAVGGALAGDPYSIPTALAELVLRERGFDARSLGTELPAETLARAVRDRAPRLVWIAVGVSNDRDRLVADFRAIEAAARGVSAAVVVGGRGLDPALRRRLRYGAFCDGMSHLATFASALAR